VSTDHGLEQDFNSLDAQYDAAQAYIRSQAHAGWTLIRTRYDDGGYSGASTERPALQRLLADVRGRKVDVIVNGAAYRPAYPLLHSRASNADLSRRPKNLGPFQREPVIAKATLDRLG
jgi:Resolvase, N terminal domain